MIVMKALKSGFDHSAASMKPQRKIRPSCSKA
jgi:hypothetical protein